MIVRPEITDGALEAAFARLQEQLDESMVKHGSGTFVSAHESLGVLTEEFHELVEAVRANDAEAVLHELGDIALVAVFAMASIEQGRAR